jgi:arginine-tRNA-protein transferase
VLKKMPKRPSPEDEIDLITIDIEPAIFSEEKYALYCSYQVAIHGDKLEDLSPNAFTKFLVDSPLVTAKKEDVGKYGSFHQLYRLRGRLIAVGVVDLLPSGLSSVYCLYDPELKALALGKYTALKEIEYCQNNGLEFYYMGFYIHSCEKMRYKAEYAPSELLCPTTFSWHPIEQCVPILDRFPFSPLEPVAAGKRAQLGAAASKEQLEATLPALFSEEDVLSIQLHHPDIGMFALDQITKGGQEQLRPVLSQWLRWTGADLAARVQVHF